MSKPGDPPEDGRTVFDPSSAAEPGGDPKGIAEPARPGRPPRRSPRSAPPVAPTQPRGGSIKIGAVLNGIYEVRRFIARGGMGEVYEGVNINNPKDRVAIKVMLAHLASDAKAQALFRREGHTLTDLSHPVLVRYRLAAQEPTLGVPYIVTEFVDGEQLSEVMGKSAPSTADVIALLRRLAQGLAAAHELGVFHRDLSPDNIMLPGGRLDKAKIIDFGIATALGASEHTVMDGGFAGRLAYAAPEQLGEYKGEIGPWTDVYSLALVGIAYASGRAPEMGATLVEAVDRRRAGPNVSAAPPALQAVLRKMLAADPAKRLRSMDAVVRALDEIALDTPRNGGFAAPITRGLGRLADGASAVIGRLAAWRPPGLLQALPRPALYAALAAPVVIGGVLAVALMPRVPAAPPASAPSPATIADPKPELARKGVESEIPNTPCASLEIEAADMAADGVRIKVRGAAADPVDVSNRLAPKAAQAAGGSAAIDTVAVQKVAPSACQMLDLFRAHREVRANSALVLTPAQPSFERATLQANCPRGSWAKPVIDIAVDDPAKDFTLLILHESGWIEQTITNRGDPGATTRRRSVSLTKVDNDKFRYVACRQENGAEALVLIKGTGPFDLGLRPGVMSRPSPALSAAFAAHPDWTVQMAWFSLTNAVGDTVEPVATDTPYAIGPVTPQSLPEHESAAPAPAPPPPPSVAADEPGEKKPCLENGSYLGDFSQATCLRKVFTGRCEVTKGSWGEYALRRKGAQIEGRKTGQFRYRALAPSDCPIT